MKKGQTAVGIVERMDFPNKGIVRLLPDEEGAEQTAVRITVKNALPGQTILFRVTKKRKDRVEGNLLEVLSPAPEEIASDCPHFGSCGGCLLRTLPYDEQLKLKEGQVLRVLREVCEEPHFEGILPSPRETEYRNKMEFSFGDAFKDGPLCLGMHKRGSFYDIVTADACRIVDEDFRMILQHVLALAESWQLSYFHRQTHVGYLRHLLVRKAANTGEILVDLVTSGYFPERADCCTAGCTSESVFEQELTNMLKSLPTNGNIVGILHTRNDAAADVIRDEGTKILYGQDWFYEELLGLKFKITPFSFFQTNSKGAEVLYGKVREYVGDTPCRELFDLYSGTGTIAQILAPVAEHVTGVEIVPEAVKAAEENAKLNGLTNCSFITGDVLKVIDELGTRPDMIILDPPREGIHVKALPRIIGFNVERMVYVSCKVTSLARDLVTLQEAGYRVVRSCCIDLFPATGNVEVVCLLSVIV